MRLSRPFFYFAAVMYGTTAPLQFQFNLLPWSAELNAGAGGLKSSTANDDYHDSRRQSQRSTSCLCSWQFSSVALRGRLVGFSARGALCNEKLDRE